MQPQWELGAPPQVVNRTIGDFENGNLETVAIMQGIARKASADPRVRQLALNVLQQNSVASHNYIDEARALAQFVQQNVRYVRDPNGIEQLHDPIYMIDQITKGTAQGDCDDQALLLASMLLTIGAQPFFAIVRFNSTRGAYNHIYTVVYDKNWNGRRKRLVMDTIIKDKPIGFEAPYASKQEIPV